MNKYSGYVVSGLSAAVLFASLAACTSETADEDKTAEDTAALINTGGNGVADGDACSITGGPNSGKSGTRSGNFCCTGAGGTGHCQDCTTPSGWCSEGKKVTLPVSPITILPVKPPVLMR